MPLVAALKDGQFVNSTSSTSISNAKEENSSGMDSDAFLQLLVAEMQNQDPLEPTSNTEWVSQYATFTQVSEIQKIGDDMQTMQAQNLVGEYVIMKVTDATSGESNYVSGQVDYVVYEEGKAYLSIDNQLYSVDDLDTVTSKDYIEAYNLAEKIAKDYKDLPEVNALTSSYKNQVNELYDKVTGLTTYQEKFVSSDLIDSIKAYKTRMDQIVKAEDAVKQAVNSNASDKNESEGTTIVNNTTNVTNIYNNENSSEASETSKENNEGTEETNKAEETSGTNTESEEASENSEEEMEENAANNGVKEE